MGSSSAVQGQRVRRVVASQNRRAGSRKTPSAPCAFVGRKRQHAVRRTGRGTWTGHLQVSEACHARPY